MCVVYYSHVVILSEQLIGVFHLFVINKRSNKLNVKRKKENI